MYNQLMKYFYRVNKGWDPISYNYSLYYSNKAFGNTNNYVSSILNIVGDLKNKTVLDLGAGPGHNSIEFAKNGCYVTWHDVSNNYMKIAIQISQQNNVELLFSLGYLEDVKGTYDIVFCSQCWYYCIDDILFANKIYELINNNGIAYLIINNEIFFISKLKDYNFVKRIFLLFQFYINNYFNIKIGHPHPSHKKIIKLFSRFKFKYLSIKRENHFTIVICKK